MTKYVISPITTSYLTEGKKYEVIEERVWDSGENTLAKIIDDDGDHDDPRHILYKECGHLNGLDWVVVEENKEIKQEEEQMKDLSVAKVGDEYRCVNGNGWVSFTEGVVYKVTEITQDCVFLDYQAVSDCFYSDFEKVEQKVTQTVDFNTTVSGTIDGVEFELVNPTWQGLLEGFMDSLEDNGFEIDPKRKKAILSIAKHAKIEL